MQAPSRKGTTHVLHVQVKECTILFNLKLELHLFFMASCLRISFVEVQTYRSSFI